MRVNRDSQRSKVYKAENQVFSFKEEKLETMAQAQLVVNEVINSDYYKSNKGWKRVKLSDGRGSRRAFYYYDDRRVSLPKGSRMRWVIIHEMAHCLTHKTVGDDVGHHGSFCTHYANMVSELIGVDKARELTKAFRRNKVLYQAQSIIFDDECIEDAVSDGQEKAL